MISSAGVHQPTTFEAATGEPVFHLQIGMTTLFLALAVLAVAAASFSGTLSLIALGVTRDDVPLALDHVSKVTKFLLKFDLGGEQTVAAWLSSMMLMMCALTLFYIATMKRHRRQVYAKHWLGLSVIFLVMSMDEAVGFHEMTIMPMRELFHAGGMFLYAWVIPGLLFVGTVGLAYLGFLRHLEPAFRLRFVVAGVLFVGGAVGCEMLEGAFADFYRHHRLVQEIAMHIEDMLEFAGTLLFLNSLLLYARSQDRTLQLHLV